MAYTNEQINSMTPAQLARLRALPAGYEDVALMPPPVAHAPLPVIPGVPTDKYSQWVARVNQYADYAKAQGATPDQLNQYLSRLSGDFEFGNYGNGDPAAGWSTYLQQYNNDQANIARQNAEGSGWPPPNPTTTPPPTGGGGTTPPPVGGGGTQPPPVGGGGGGGGGVPGGNTTSPTDFYGTLPKAFRTFEGYPEGSGNLPLLPGYGFSQQINNTGIAGFDRNQLIGGGSWAGTVWNPPSGEARFTQNPVQLPETEFYDSNGNPKPLTQGNISIRPALPYTTTNFLQTYGGVPAPFANIHQQIGASMAGLPAAYPSFKWASPESMKLGQPGATGAPPGGWTQMLGYNPGAPVNANFVGGRLNPYGFTGLPLGAVNPAIG